MVQWLRLCPPKAEGAGSIPGWETKIPYVAQLGQEKMKNWSPSVMLLDFKSLMEGQILTD